VNINEHFIACPGLAPVIDRVVNCRRTVVTDADDGSVGPDQITRH
jgi:hypothetical protein